MDFNNVSRGIFEYRSNYSGDLISPDSIDIVIKKDHTFYSHTFLPWNNEVACVPFYGSFYAVKKIIHATKIIFQELRKETPTSELKNAFKNLGRGFIELFPLVSIFLLVYDNFNGRQRLHKLEQDLRLEDSVAKIFVNGQLAETIPLTAIKLDLPIQTGEQYKSKLKALCEIESEYDDFEDADKLTFFRNFLNHLRRVSDGEEIDIEDPEDDFEEPIAEIDPQVNLDQEEDFEPMD